MATNKVPERRVMRLMVTPDFLVTMLKARRPFRTYLKGTPLSEDAHSVGVTHDFYTNKFCIFVASAAFDVVKEAEMPPELPSQIFYEEEV